MSYSAWSVVFGEQPTASKWNILGTNDASFNNGTGFNANVLGDSLLKYGKLKARQGGNSGTANSWRVSGTTNSDLFSTDNVEIQVGAASSSSGGDVTVTFPYAFSQIPLIILSVNAANGGTGAVTQNAWAECANANSSSFTLRTFNTGGTASDQMVAWMAIGAP